MGKRLTDSGIPSLKKAFDDSYTSNFGYCDSEALVEGVTWHLSARCPAPPVKLRKFEKGRGSEEKAVKERREVYFPENRGFIECNIYDRYRLFPGMTIIGPAVVEERESTTVITPGDMGEVDEWGNLLITLKKLV
jgi:N-methylhydantoinase A/oxoprolinase/acetone carboxylase beta subunit